jgi:alkanesulfonate monooxygenase SsuD/methylene tetrahydromethanopterin reductase-like flavin-dependent oxidoreductase (luciferase family)/predicted kinase
MSAGQDGPTTAAQSTNQPPPGATRPAVVVLAGPSGSGKSTWASAHYRESEIVSSDRLRAAVGTGPADLEASSDAFAILNLILEGRVGRRLTTVVDTLGLETVRRRKYLELARRAGLPAALIVFDTPAGLCRRRNATRDRPVPAAALTGQLKRVREVIVEAADEGWDQIVVLRDATPPEQPAALPASQGPRPVLEFVLQISRFPWGEDPAGWLSGVARGAADAGFAGIALMDHLIQIPQVGRAWDPIPEPWVTLGLLAGLDLGLRLGTLVSPVTFRAPGIIAKAAATLDALSGGRAFCGLGAGWWEREHAAFGLPFPTHARRLDQLERCIETMRALWSPGTKAYAGRAIDLPETTCYPRPLGDIPIIVGGGGEQRTLRIAAEFADGCNVQGEPAVVSRKIDVLRRHCAELGRNPEEVAITVLDVPVIGADREQVASRLERVRGRSPASALAWRSGTAGDQIHRYRRLAELGAQTVFIAPAELRGPGDVTQFAEVIRAFG